METTIVNGQSKGVMRTYQTVAVLFLVLGVVSLLPALLFLYRGFFGKAVFLFGYTFLNAVFAYGLWKRQRWMVSLSLINFCAIVIAKAFGLWKGVTTGTNFLVSILVVGILAGSIYITRASLKGEHRAHPVVLITYLVILIPVMMRAIGVL